MQEVQLLGDIIANLLSQGYCLDFEALEQFKLDWSDKGLLKSAAKEFVVDKVYRCCEYEGANEMVYVFALSSVKLGLKGIVVNIVTPGSTFSLKEWYQKLKTNIVHLFRTSG